MLMLVSLGLIGPCPGSAVQKAGHSRILNSRVLKIRQYKSCKRSK